MVMAIQHYLSGNFLIPLKYNSASSELKMFSTNVFLGSSWGNFCHSEHFVENAKDVNHLVQGLVNIIDGVEQTSLNPIFFPLWFLLSMAFCVIMKKHNIFSIDKCKKFS